MIDINGKKTLSWEEFTTFLVDQGMTEDVSHGFRVIKFNQSYVRDELPHQSHVDKAISHLFKHVRGKQKRK